MEKINKMLVPADFSGCSEAAIHYAVFLARQLNATVLLLHVMEPIGYPIDFALVSPLAYGELKRGVGQALERAADAWRIRGISVDVHLVGGDPAAEIVKAAQNLECDLIVIGTHGRKGIAHALMGSVAERVVRSSPIPVLTVKQQKETEGARQETEISKATRGADLGKAF